MSTIAGNQSETQARAESGETRAAQPDYIWICQVTLMCVFLGGLVALGLRTTNRINQVGLPSSRLGVSAALISRFKEDSDRLQQEVDRLREQLAEYQANSEDDRRTAELLQAQLEEYQVMGGLLPVKGPGLKITLRQTPYRHVDPNLPLSAYLPGQEEVSALISELWASGAEAVAIAGANTPQPQRFISRTSILGGETHIGVNGQQLVPPYTIFAIGNSKELRSALEMPDGVVENYHLKLLDMIEIEEVRQLVLHAYAQSTGN